LDEYGFGGIDATASVVGSQTQIIQKEHCIDDKIARANHFSTWSIFNVLISGSQTNASLEWRKSPAIMKIAAR
jgi:hypothetical protein